MRITGGELRGRSLPGRVPQGVRPTPARVREALFSMLRPELEGRTLLDAFGGSGILSFEALSRGAAHARILEKQSRAAHAIRTAAAALGLSDRVRVQVGHVPRDLGDGVADLVLADPPYALDPAPILAALAPLTGQLLVLEHARKTPPPQVPGLRLERSRRYGDTVLSLYRPAPQTAEPA